LAGGRNDGFIKGSGKLGGIASTPGPEEKSSLGDRRERTGKEYKEKEKKRKAEEIGEES